MSPHGVLRVENPLGVGAVEALELLALVVHEGPLAAREVLDEGLLPVVTPPTLGAPRLGLEELVPAELTRDVARLDGDLDIIVPSSLPRAPSPVVLIPQAGVESFVTSGTPVRFLLLRLDWN